MALLDLITGTLRESAGEPRAVLEPTADDAVSLAAASATGGPIAIRFPGFGDGRGHSLSVKLRERHGFKGEIRAVGYLIPDLAPFLLRSGFDTAEIADASEIETWKAALTRIRHNYQPGFRNPQPLRRDASTREAEELNLRLGSVDRLSDRIAELRRSIEGRITFSTSLGLEDQAILHAIAEQGADIEIFTLDTGRLFPEVLETVELSELRYGLRIRLVAPEAAEVEALVARDGVFGFRREHSDGRSDVKLAAWDEAHALIKLNPIADWSTQQLTAYIAEHNIPVNPLHARGFISIGCAPCTRAVQPGENARAGRWWWEHEEKKECGIHLNPRREGKAA